ncbi:PstS family phosphate ABC transporter substrate-binding protein [Skermanella pratensis]|uniref:PstS family phosphate ABC transporter substrate-binding protein n=1 Tax=Skermanella pratensis TaxID=2233999 RepID=UPI001B3C0493|nr:PstS family phosphate ABC transporter substrate-binding protein [Skermanella pratensis]
MKLTPCAGAFALAAATLIAADANAQNVPTVVIDGSSTVFPISEAMAEEFQSEKAGATRVTVGVSGTGGGFQKFCRGETDISGASRPISSSEMKQCQENGVEYIEMPVALDALATIVHPNNDWLECADVEDLKKMWQPEAQGTVTRWNQVRGEWPDAPLALYGAGTDSGTYDYYTFAVVGKEHSSRGDYTATEDDNITVQGVSTDVHALGFLGLAYVTENMERIKPVAIRQANGECVLPSVETAADASYQPLSRPIFYYISKKSADEKEHVREFAAFIFDAENQKELVTEVGYVPLPATAAEAAMKKFEARTTGTFFGGSSKIGVKIEDLVSASGAN